MSHTVPGVSSELHLAHLSDTHVGYEAYRVLSARGNNQRGEDVVRAMIACVDEIISADPPLVIHSGDVADRPGIPVRLILLLRQQFTRLAGLRPDGTRRQVVVISGNHDQPANRKEACYLELLRGIPGVHVVTNHYETVTFDGTGTSLGCDPDLGDVAVHALPHDVLKTVDFAAVAPLEGHRNILTVHGVAGGSELYVRSLGREFAVPTDVLARDWSYVALGHWHLQGPVPLVATGGSRTNGEIGRVWYAGSTENMGFGDMLDNGERRGWLQVRLRSGELPDVTRRNVPIRTMFRLPHLDANGMSPEQIAAALSSNLKQATVTGAVVGQVVTGVTRELWSLVDLVSVRAHANGALHYEISVRYARPESRVGSAAESLGGLGAVLEARAKELFIPELAEPALRMARTLLGSALTAPVSDDAPTEASQPVDPSSGNEPNTVENTTAAGEAQS